MSETVTNLYFSSRFDAELQSLNDDLRAEKLAKDRLTREKDIAVSSKSTMEQTLSVSNFT